MMLTLVTMMKVSSLGPFYFSEIMATINNNSEESSARNKKRPAWKYSYLEDPKNPNIVSCDKTTSYDIFQATT